MSRDASLDLESAWGRTICAASKIEYKVFDKPGMYHPVDIWAAMFTGSSKIIEGYLRDDEIQDGVENKKRLVQVAKQNYEKAKADLDKRGPVYQEWLKRDKTDDGIRKHLEQWAADNDRLERADSIKDILAIYPSYGQYSPAEFGGKFMILNPDPYKSSRGALNQKAIHRVYVIKEIEQRSPSLVSTLLNMGVSLSDKSDWGRQADQTGKALAFLQSRRKAIQTGIQTRAEESHKQAIQEVEIALREVTGKYPMADASKFPGIIWFVGEGV